MADAWGFPELPGHRHRAPAQPLRDRARPRRGPRSSPPPTSTSLITHFLGLRTWTPDGYGTPYLSALAAGSITAVVLGGYLLARSMRGYLTRASRPRGGRRAPRLAGRLLHVRGPRDGARDHVLPGVPRDLGVVRSGESAVLADLVRARARRRARSPSHGWQGLVIGLLPAALAARQLSGRSSPTGLARGRGRPRRCSPSCRSCWPGSSSSDDGSRSPRARGYVDWSSPHFVDVLFSAHARLLRLDAGHAGGHGSASCCWRRTMPTFAAASLAVMLATAWINGGMKDWEASDAFGGAAIRPRRPLRGLGLAALSRTPRGGGCKGAPGRPSRPASPRSPSGTWASSGSTAAGDSSTPPLSSGSSAPRPTSSTRCSTRVPRASARAPRALALQPDGRRILLLQRQPRGYHRRGGGRIAMAGRRLVDRRSGGRAGRPSAGRSIRERAFAARCSSRLVLRSFIRLRAPGTNPRCRRCRIVSQWSDGRRALLLRDGLDGRPVHRARGEPAAGHEQCLLRVRRHPPYDGEGRKRQPRCPSSSCLKV